jgi:hypothetical protein
MERMMITIDLAFKKMLMEKVGLIGGLLNSTKAIAVGAVSCIAKVKFGHLSGITILRQAVLYCDSRNLG